MKKFLSSADKNEFTTFLGTDSIGINNNIGSLAVNNFSAPGLLISSSKFSEPSVEKYLKTKKIKIETSPVSQFQLSGGSIHCLTNEL